MKKKIIFISSLEDAPDGAEFPILVPDQIETPNDPPTQENNNFVKVVDGEFNINGKRVKYAGTNGYYLPTYENHNTSFCDATWNLFKSSKINLVRTWGFYDGPPKYDGDPSFQTFENRESIYNEEGLQCLDKTVAKASESGIYLILSLINYHSELGGYREYCKAANIPETFSSFINSTLAQKLYMDYITMLLNRVNTVTGTQYKNEPYILGWEICNEARNRGNDPKMLRDWYQTIAQHIKSIDSNHLVTTGEDGFDDSSTGSWGNDGKIQNVKYSVSDYSNTYVLRANEGTSYILNMEIPEIDFGSFHWYPSDFGFGYTVNDDLLRSQAAWINDHVLIAQDSNKPTILGEYGFHVNWSPNLEVYSHIWKMAETGLAGALIWQLVTDGVKRTEFGGNISPDRGPYDLFVTYVDTINKI